MDWLIVGLGNPGQRYEGTRHNVGFDVVDELRKNCQSSSEWRTREQSLVAEGVIEGCSVSLMKPMTFMNVTGSAVGEFARYFKVGPSRIIVIHDDLDLNPGTIRVKIGGGDGGHNGIKSVVVALGTEDFPRVKVGIGRPADGPQGKIEGAVSRWVLEKFSAEERPILSEAIKRGVRAAVAIATKGVAAAQMEVNGVRP